MTLSGETVERRVAGRLPLLTSAANGATRRHFREYDIVPNLDVICIRRHYGHGIAYVFASGNKERA